MQIDACTFFYIGKTIDGKVKKGIDISKLDSYAHQRVLIIDYII